MSDSIKNLIKRLRSYDEKKEDIILSAASIRYDGEFFYLADRPVKVTPTCLRQLCWNARIPGDFFIERLKAKEQSIVFNRIFGDMADTQFMYRLSKDVLYGLVSPRYTKLDNIQIVSLLKGAANSGLDLVPVVSYLDPVHSKIRLIPSGLQRNELVPLIEVTNSECGIGSLRIWSGVHRVLCENGMLAPVHGQQSRWIHSGNNELRLPDFNIVLNQSIRFVKLLDQSRTQYLSASDKARILKGVYNTHGQHIADRVVEIANEQYNSGSTLFFTINAITASARTLLPASQTNVEEYASSLLSVN